MHGNRAFLATATLCVLSVGAALADDQHPIKAKDRAERDAKHVKGVVDVINKLDVEQ